jgi:predicted secreted protein
MKILKIFNIIIVILFCLFACTSKQTSLEVACDQFAGKKHLIWEIKIQRSESFLLTLCSNPTTGFQWVDPAQISNENIITQTSHNIIHSEGDVPGSASKEEWIFKPLNKGKSTLALEYSRPWEGGEKREWSLTVFVDVD